MSKTVGTEGLANANTSDDCWEGTVDSGSIESTTRAAAGATRRRFLHAGLWAGVAGLLAACSPAVAPAATGVVAPPEQPTAAAAPTASAAPAQPPARPASTQASAAAIPTQAGAAPQAAPVVPLAQRTKVRTSLTGANIFFLPLFMAIDSGAFANAGIDLDVAQYQGSSVSQMPLLARGDLDITPLAVGPALFNQVAQGFNIRVVASVGLETKGRVTSGWLTLLKGEAGQVKQPSDLKGKTLEAGVEGSPLDLLVRNAVAAGGLTAGQDVTISYKARTPADWLAIAQARGADAISMQEPAATQLERQDLVTRWLTFAGVAPWFQAANLTVSDSFLTNHAEVVEKFLEVYVTTCRHINAANGTWTDELMNLATKWTGVMPADISAQGGAMYYEPNGLPSADALSQAQTFWQRAGQVQQAVDMNQLVATAPLDAALAKLGRA